MDRIPTDPTRRPPMAAPLALWSLAGVLARVRGELERVAVRAAEIELRAAAGEVRAGDVAQLAGLIRTLALGLLSVEGIAALQAPPAVAPARLSGSARAGLVWRAIRGR